jgi:hypothetical protein
MIRLVVRYRGRKLSMALPDEADVEIDLNDTSSFDHAPDRVAFRQAGPSAKKLYKWLLSIARGKEVISIDPVIAEADLGMVPISLGKTLSSLEKIGLIEIMKRRKAQSSRVVSYQIKIVDKNQEVYSAETASSPWEDTVGDIEVALGKGARALFEALFKIADIDGNIIGVQPREVCFTIRPIPDSFPFDELERLDSSEYITVNDKVPLNLSITGYQSLRKSLDDGG